MCVYVCMCMLTNETKARPDDAVVCVCDCASSSQMSFGVLLPELKEALGPQLLPLMGGGNVRRSLMAEPDVFEVEQMVGAVRGRKLRDRMKSPAKQVTSGRSEQDSVYASTIQANTCGIAVLDAHCNPVLAPAGAGPVRDQASLYGAPSGRRPRQARGGGRRCRAPHAQHRHKHPSAGPCARSRWARHCSSAGTTPSTCARAPAGTRNGASGRGGGGACRSCGGSCGGLGYRKGSAGARCQL